MNRFLQFAKTAIHNACMSARVALVSEPNDWVIKEISKELATALGEEHPGIAAVTYRPTLLRHKIIHFGSVNTLIAGKKIRPFHASNRGVITWYHIVPEDARLALIPELEKQVDLIHTTCTKTATELLAHGLSKNKLVVIPEAIDLNLFTPFSANRRAEARSLLNLPKDRFIIGSFQKDGVGWGDGAEPKLIKGPDIFCEAVKEIAEHVPVHVLLTGPARGFVKNKLSEYNVPFTHHFLKKYQDIVSYYNALDVYLITSRVEGGPKAVLESLATATPLVSTPVGMAPDVIENEKSGFVLRDFNPSTVAEAAVRVLKNQSLREALVSNGLKRAKEYAWPRIAARYYNELYAPLFAKLK